MGETCVTMGAMSRCMRTPTLGEPCSTSCQFPYACRSGTCVAAGRAGEPCIPNSPVPCLVGECLGPDGGIQSSTSGSCSAPRADGAPCQTDLGCASGFCDRASLFTGTGVCVAACR
jgi:hypothetical protein